MNTEIKTEWLKVLRSGSYVQGEKLLKSENGFCCLGVLCEAVLLPMGLVEHLGPSAYIDTGNWYTMRINLTTNIIGQIDLLDEDMSTLMGMNDGTCGYQKHTFEEIANYIEENL